MIRTNKYAIMPISAARKKQRDPYAFVLLWQSVLCGVVLALVVLLGRLNPTLWAELKAEYKSWLTSDFTFSAQAAVQDTQAVAENLKKTLEDGISDLNTRAKEIFDYEEEAGEPASSPLFFVSDVFSQISAPEGMGGEGTPENCTFSPVILSSFLKPPASGKVTSAYGWREHPITEKQDFHRGIDIAAPMGAAIRVVLPGRVAEVGESPVYGNFVRMEHGNGVESTYSHCAEIKALEGEFLREGELIATVGSTGISTGPHVHFELFVNGSYYDPAWVMNGLKKHGS